MKNKRHRDKNEIQTTGILRAFLKWVFCVYCLNHMFGTENDESETTGDGLFSVTSEVNKTAVFFMFIWRHLSLLHINPMCLKCCSKTSVLFNR